MLSHVHPKELQSSYDVLSPSGCGFHLSSRDCQIPQTALLWLIMFIMQWERTGFAVKFQLANYSLYVTLSKSVSLLQFKCGIFPVSSFGSQLGVLFEEIMEPCGWETRLM